MPFPEGFHLGDVLARLVVAEEAVCFSRDRRGCRVLGPRLHHFSPPGLGRHHQLSRRPVLHNRGRQLPSLDNSDVGIVVESIRHHAHILPDVSLVASKVTMLETAPVVEQWDLRSVHQHRWVPVLR